MASSHVLLGVTMFVIRFIPFTLYGMRQSPEVVQLGCTRYSTQQTAGAPLAKFEQLLSDGTRHTVLDVNKLAKEYGPSITVGEVGPSVVEADVCSLSAVQAQFAGEMDS